MMQKTERDEHGQTERDQAVNAEDSHSMTSGDVTGVMSDQHGTGSTVEGDDTEMASSHQRPAAHTSTRVKTLTPFCLRNRRDDTATPFAIIKPIEEGRRLSGSQVGIASWTDSTDQTPAKARHSTGMLDVPERQGQSTSADEPEVWKNLLHAQTGPTSSQAIWTQPTTAHLTTDCRTPLDSPSSTDTLHASTTSLPDRVSPRPRATIFGDIRERVFGSKQSAPSVAPTSSSAAQQASKFFNFLSKNDAPNNVQTETKKTMPSDALVAVPATESITAHCVEASSSSGIPQDAGQVTDLTMSPVSVTTFSTSACADSSSSEQVTEIKTEPKELDSMASATSVPNVTSSSQTVMDSGTRGSQFVQMLHPTQPLTPEQVQHEGSRDLTTVTTGGTVEYKRFITPGRDRWAPPPQSRRTAEVSPWTKSNSVASSPGMQYTLRQSADVEKLVGDVKGAAGDKSAVNDETVKISNQQSANNQSVPLGTLTEIKDNKPMAPPSEVDSDVLNCSSASPHVTTRNKITPSGMSRVDWAKQRFADTQPLDSCFGTVLSQGRPSSEQVSPKVPRRHSSTHGSSTTSMLPSRSEYIPNDVQIVTGNDGNSVMAATSLTSGMTSTTLPQVATTMLNSDVIPGKLTTTPNNFISQRVNVQSSEATVSSRINLPPSHQSTNFSTGNVASDLPELTNLPTRLGARQTLPPVSESLSKFAVVHSLQTTMPAPQAVSSLKTIDTTTVTSSSPHSVSLPDVLSGTKSGIILTQGPKISTPAGDLINPEVMLPNSALSSVTALASTNVTRTTTPRLQTFTNASVGELMPSSSSGSMVSVHGTAPVVSESSQSKRLTVHTTTSQPLRVSHLNISATSSVSKSSPSETARMMPSRGDMVTSIPASQTFQPLVAGGASINSVSINKQPNETESSAKSLPISTTIANRPAFSLQSVSSSPSQSLPMSAAASSRPAFSPQSVSSSPSQSLPMSAAASSQRIFSPQSVSSSSSQSLPMSAAVSSQLAFSPQSVSSSSSTSLPMSAAVSSQLAFSPQSVLSPSSQFSMLPQHPATSPSRQAYTSPAAEPSITSLLSTVSSMHPPVGLSVLPSVVTSQTMTSTTLSSSSMSLAPAAEMHDAVGMDTVASASAVLPYPVEPRKIDSHQEVTSTKAQQFSVTAALTFLPAGADAILPASIPARSPVSHQSTSLPFISSPAEVALLESSSQVSVTQPIGFTVQPVETFICARPAPPTIAVHISKPQVPDIQLTVQELKPCIVLDSLVPESKFVLVTPTKPDDDRKAVSRPAASRATQQQQPGVSSVARATETNVEPQSLSPIHTDHVTNRGTMRRPEFERSTRVPQSTGESIRSTLSSTQDRMKDQMVDQWTSQRIADSNKHLPGILKPQTGPGPVSTVTSSPQTQITSNSQAATVKTSSVLVGSRPTQSVASVGSAAVSSGATDSRPVTQTQMSRLSLDNSSTRSTSTINSQSQPTTAMSQGTRAAAVTGRSVTLKEAQELDQALADLESIAAETRMLSKSLTSPVATKTPKSVSFSAPRVTRSQTLPSSSSAPLLSGSPRTAATINILEQKLNQKSVKHVTHQALVPHTLDGSGIIKKHLVHLESIFRPGAGGADSQTKKSVRLPRPKPLLRKAQTVDLTHLGIGVDPDLAQLLKTRKEKSASDDEEMMSTAADSSRVHEKQVEADEGLEKMPSVAERIKRMETKKIRFADLREKAAKRRLAQTTSDEARDISPLPSIDTTDQQKLDRLSCFAAISDTGVAQRRRKLQWHSLVKGRRLSQPDTLDELQKADSLPSVAAWRAEVVKLTNINPQFGQQFRWIGGMWQRPFPSARDRVQSSFADHRSGRGHQHHRRSQSLPVQMSRDPDHGLTSHQRDIMLRSTGRPVQARGSGHVTSLDRQYYRPNRIQQPVDAADVPPPKQHLPRIFINTEDGGSGRAGRADGAGASGRSQVTFDGENWFSSPAVRSSPSSALNGLESNSREHFGETRLSPSAAVIDQTSPGMIMSSTMSHIFQPSSPQPRSDLLSAPQSTSCLQPQTPQLSPRWTAASESVSSSSSSRISGSSSPQPPVSPSRTGPGTDSRQPQQNEPQRSRPSLQRRKPERTESVDEDEFDKLVEINFRQLVDTPTVAGRDPAGLLLSPLSEPSPSRFSPGVSPGLSPGLASGSLSSRTGLSPAGLSLADSHRSPGLSPRLTRRAESFPQPQSGPGGMGSGSVAAAGRDAERGQVRGQGSTAGHPGPSQSSRYEQSPGSSREHPRNPQPARLTVNTDDTRRGTEEVESEDELSNLSLADKLKLFSGSQTSQQSTHGSSGRKETTGGATKGRRHLVRYQTQPVTFEELEQVHDWSRDSSIDTYGTQMSAGSNTAVQSSGSHRMIYRDY